MRKFKWDTRICDKGKWKHRYTRDKGTNGENEENKNNGGETSAASTMMHDHVDVKTMM